MDIDRVDPRDTTWESHEPEFRVLLWQRNRDSLDSYDLSGASFEEAYRWAHKEAGRTNSDLGFAVKALDEFGRPGLIYLTPELGV